MTRLRAWMRSIFSYMEGAYATNQRSRRSREVGIVDVRENEGQAGQDRRSL